MQEHIPASLTLDPHLPLLGIAAWSGTGKTTLLEAMLPRLRAQGLTVAVIKHAHHTFDIDQPGKDSYRLREAGAAPMLIASRERLALVLETPGQQEPDLARLVAMVAIQRPDLVLVEGFKTWPLPKLALHRQALGKPLAALDDTWVVGVASDTPLALPAGVERLDLNDHSALAEWIAEWPERWREPQRWSGEGAFRPHAAPP